MYTRRSMFTTAIACALAVAAAAALQRDARNDLLPNHPGNFSVAVEKTSRTAMVSAGEHAGYNRNLARMLDLLRGLPAFGQPKGVEIWGSVNLDSNPPADRRAPLEGRALLRFFSYSTHPTTKQPVRSISTDAEIIGTINTPCGTLEPFDLRESKTQYYVEPRRTGDVHGFPVYRTRKGNEVVVFTTSARPLWVPVTREEYVAVWLDFWKKTLATTGGDPVTSKIVARHEAMLAAMSPEERRMQARHFQDPLGPPVPADARSTQGTPLVKANPEWYDPALPRSSFQLITLRFTYAGDLDPDRPGPMRGGEINALRVWEALHRSDWGPFAAALARE